MKQSQLHLNNKQQICLDKQHCKDKNTSASKALFSLLATGIAMPSSQSISDRIELDILMNICYSKAQKNVVNSNSERCCFLLHRMHHISRSTSLNRRCEMVIRNKVNMHCTTSNHFHEPTIFVLPGSHNFIIYLHEQPKIHD